MRLRATCKCGSEFEARGKFVSEAWGHWQRLHTPCLGIESYRYDESGKLIWRPLSPQATPSGAESGARNETEVA